MATQGIIWVVPGFGGSELYAVGFGGRLRVWLDPASIIQGGAQQYLLWGQAPPGVTVVPGGLMDMLGFGYGSMVRALRTMFGDNYEIRPYPYDWRETAVNLGQTFAGAVRIAGALPLGQKVVCHSYGTLVTQAAMRYLKDAGQDGLVNRVVAIGAIFSGSYGTIKTWREEEDSANILASLATRSAFGFALNRNAQASISAKIPVLQSFASWPSVYDMMPDPAATEDPGDTARSQAWDPAQWVHALVPPDTAKMAWSAANFHPWIHQAASAPDQSKWVTVVGIDPEQSTPQRIWKGGPVGVGAIPQFVTSDPYYSSMIQRRNKLPGLLYTSQGDNRATVASQTRPGLPTLFVRGAHADLQTHPDVLSYLPNLLGIGSQMDAVKVSETVVWPERARQGQFVNAGPDPAGLQRGILR